MATGPIATFGAITAGSGYTDGTYTDVPLTGGSGSGAAANIIVAGGAVTAVALPSLSASAILDRTGKNYQVADNLTTSSPALGTGTGFVVAVLTLAKACENCLFGLVIPATAGNVAGQRYCSDQSYLNQEASARNAWEPLVTPDEFFCADGADKVSKVSFQSDVVAQPATQQFAPNWNIYTPTISCGSGAFGGPPAPFGTLWYATNGKIVTFSADVQIPHVGTAGTNIQVTVPANLVSGRVGAVAAYQVGGTVPVQAYINNNILYITGGTGAFPAVDGSEFVLGGSYQTP